MIISLLSKCFIFEYRFSHPSSPLHENSWDMPRNCKGIGLCLVEYGLLKHCCKIISW